MSGSRGVVTLVHGTFARRARWLGSASKISSQLKDAGYEVEVCKWSGRNSFRARSAAASQLRRHLEDQALRYPGLRQVVVAHSHGGNVALLASRQLPDPGPLVVALATPFIFARRRDLDVSFFAAAAASIAFAMLTVLVLAFIGPTPTNVHLHWWESAIGGLAAVELLIIAIGMLMHGRITHAEVRERLITGSHAPKSTGGNLLVIRAPGDEASGLLISGQFVSWLSGRLTQGAFRTVGLFGILVFTVGVFGGLAIVSDHGSLRLGTDMAEIGLIAYATMLIFAFALISSLILPSLAFGIDGPYISLIAATTAESAPPGECTLIQLDSTPAGIEKRGFSHSSLYSDDAVITAIIRWANSFTVDLPDSGQ